MSMAIPVTAIWLGIAFAGLLGCSSAKPFTREAVAVDLQRLHAGISLPPDLPIAGVRDRFDIAYAQRDGRDLLLDLFTPVVPGTYPGVIVVHGGAWKTGHRAMERPLARHLAARGFVTATVGYRLGPHGRFPNALLDVKAAVVWLRAHAAECGVDAARIGAIGGSAGGQLVALAGATNGNPAFQDANGFSDGGAGLATSHLAAVVDIDGLADFTGAALVVKETRSPGAPTLFLGGTFVVRGDAWRAASALTHVGPASAPTLFINSTAPTPLLPGRIEMRDRLRSLGIDSEIVVMPGTPHPFWLVNPWFAPTLDAAERFLRKHLVRATASSP